MPFISNEAEEAWGTFFDSWILADSKKSQSNFSKFSYLGQLECKGMRSGSGQVAAAAAGAWAPRQVVEEALAGEATAPGRAAPTPS